MFAKSIHIFTLQCVMLMVEVASISIKWGIFVILWGIYTLNKIKSTQMEKYTDIAKTLLQIK